MIKIVYLISAFLILVGALAIPFSNTIASIIYLIGAVTFSAVQFISRYKGANFVIRRLTVQQTLGNVALIAAGVLMLTLHGNEWILAMTIGALLQLYTSFRISHETDKK